MNCSFCDSPTAHPATGCQYTERFIACAACTRSVWAWVRQHTASKGRRRGPSFYDHVNVIAPPIFVDEERSAAGEPEVA